jgi:hypothetical protein
MFVFQSNLRPRNPLLRLIGGVLGLVVVLGLVALGLFAFIAMFAVGAVWYLIHLFRAKRPPASRPKSPADENGVIDGEFTVVASGDQRTRIEHPASRRFD